MTRDKWRELCAKTPKGNCGTPRFVHVSVRMVKVPTENGHVYLRTPGLTYRKG